MGLTASAHVPLGGAPPSVSAPTTVPIVGLVRTNSLSTISVDLHPDLTLNNLIPFLCEWMYEMDILYCWNQVLEVKPADLGPMHWSIEGVDPKLTYVVGQCPLCTLSARLWGKRLGSNPNMFLRSFTLFSVTLYVDLWILSPMRSLSFGFWELGFQ